MSMMKAKEHIEEREQLRKSINKGCRANTVFYVIAGLFFLINGIVHVDDVSDRKLYLCPLIALMLISTITMGFYAMIYDRIRRASTGREMQKFLDLLGPDSKFSKLIIIIDQESSAINEPQQTADPLAKTYFDLQGLIIFAAILGLMDKSPWYVIVLAVVGIAAVIYGLWWLLKYTGMGEARDKDVERLCALEEQDQ